MTREEAYYILGLIAEGQAVTKLAMKEAAKIAINNMDELDSLRDEIDCVFATVESWKRR